MFKFLAVGDMHVQKHDIEECRKLIDYIIEIGTTQNIQDLVFLGDGFHTHAQIDSYVLSFWKETFDKLYKYFYTYYIVGNHDKGGAGVDDGPHALKPFLNHEAVTIIESSMMIDRGVYAIPHYYKNDTFLKSISKEAKTILCHQTFDGAQYDNGFFAPDGADVSSFKDTIFVSGHIHTSSKAGNFIYLGAPRWFGVADANQPKAIWALECDDQGVLTSIVPFTTENVCNPIYMFEDTEQAPLQENLVKGKIVINIRGSESFINRRLSFYEDLKTTSKATFLIRTFPQKENKVVVRESAGLKKAFFDYLDMYEPKYNSDKKDLFKIVNERMDFLFK